MTFIANLSFRAGEWGNFTFQIQKHLPTNDSLDLEGERREGERLFSPSLPLSFSPALKALTNCLRQRIPS